MRQNCGAFTGYATVDRVLERSKPGIGRRYDEKITTGIRARRHLDVCIGRGDFRQRFERSGADEAGGDHKSTGATDRARESFSRRREEREIENEKGHLVWSFDIAKPNTKDITEILIDAQTGKIISIQTESPRDQAQEAAADKKSN
jgi:hypothetical protein